MTDAFGIPVIVKDVAERIVTQSEDQEGDANLPFPLNLLPLDEIFEKVKSVVSEDNIRSLVELAKGFDATRILEEGYVASFFDKV